MVNETRIRRAGAWRTAREIHTEYEGEWRPAKLKFIARHGKWVEAFTDEPVKMERTIEITDLKFRSGYPFQGDLVLAGRGYSNIMPPSDGTGAFYSLRSKIGDFFDNFSKLDLHGSVLPLPTIIDQQECYHFDPATEQYASTPIVGTGKVDMLGFLAGGLPPYSREWEIGGKIRPMSYNEDNFNPVIFAAESSLRYFAIWYDRAGTLHATYRKDEDIIELAIPYAVSPDDWTGFSFRHVVDYNLIGGSATRRYFVLSLHDNREVRKAGTLDIPGHGLGFNYILPVTDDIPLNIAYGQESQGDLVSPEFFIREMVYPSVSISSDGKELTGTDTQYRSARPSDLMHPGTGKYYIEVENRTSYDMHIGFSDIVFDLGTSPGISGWCINTINGRKFAKQTGGGTNWSSAIPNNSVIGLLYDSDLGKFDVYVNGVLRPTPFPNGTITAPVRFVIGGRAQTATTNLFHPRVENNPSGWAHNPGGSLKAVPSLTIPQDPIDFYSDLAIRDVYIHSTNLTDKERDSVLDMDIKFKIWFTSQSTGVKYDCSHLLLKLTEDELIIGVPDLPLGNYYIHCTVTSRNGMMHETTKRMFCIVPFESRNTPLILDFSKDDYRKVNSELMAAHKAWGGTNGGVVQDNVIFDPEAGHLEMRACGDLYTGPVKGVNRIGEPSGFNTRIGACVATRDYFGPGSYRLVAKGVQVPGVCNAFWTFHYEEGYPGAALFDECINDGIHISGDEVAGFYTVRNHEIDIEWPTALKTDMDQEAVQFTACRFNTWLGELRNWDVKNNDDPVSSPNWAPYNDPDYWSEYTDTFTYHGVDLADDQFHEFRIDWHVGPNKRVEFYIDGVLKQTITTHVPDIPGRFWAGVWFPSAATHWAGRGANFAEQSMFIKTFEIHPFVDEMQYARQRAETYPWDVYRDIKRNIS